MLLLCWLNIFEWRGTNWQVSCVICKWLHQIFYCTEKTNNQSPKFMYLLFSKSHIVLLHQQLKYDRVLVFILREVIYRFHLFNIWSKFAVITQAENCFGVLSVVAWFGINQRCGASLLNTDMHVKVTGQQMNFGCSDLQDIQVLLTLTWWFSQTEAVEKSRKN